MLKCIDHFLCKLWTRRQNTDEVFWSLGNKFTGKNVSVRKYIKPRWLKYDVFLIGVSLKVCTKLWSMIYQNSPRQNLRPIPLFWNLSLIEVNRTEYVARYKFGIDPTTNRARFGAASKALKNIASVWNRCLWFLFLTAFRQKSNKKFYIDTTK